MPHLHIRHGHVSPAIVLNEEDLRYHQELLPEMEIEQLLHNSASNRIYRANAHVPLLHHILQALGKLLRNFDCPRNDPLLFVPSLDFGRHAHLTLRRHNILSSQSIRSTGPTPGKLSKEEAKEHE